MTNLYDVFQSTNVLGKTFNDWDEVWFSTDRGALIAEKDAFIDVSASPTYALSS